MTLFDTDYALKRYATYDLLSELTDFHLLRAVKVIAGVDPQSRAIQKHPLGPLGVRFHSVRLQMG